jgi:hypothetical protein
MTSQSRGDPTSKPRILNVGIYGCTRAGKTRFLFELLRHWERSRRILVASASCQQFLRTVDGEIEKHGDSMPTAAVSPEIAVTIDRGDKEPPWQVTFRDLRGELLTDELDGGDALAREGMMSSQVEKCDAFLFLFDPSASSSSNARELHHEHELRRAELFIAYVLDRRQNDYLPIAFVHTHGDVWREDGEVSAASERWSDRVHGVLARQYRRLRGHCPPCLTDPDRVFFNTAAAEESDEAKKKLELVVEQLLDSTKACKSFKERDRKRMAVIAVAAKTLVASLVAAVLWLLLAPAPPPKPVVHDGRSGSSPIERPTTDKEAASRSKEFQAFIQKLPTGVQLPEESDAIRMNSAMQWLCIECDPTQSPSTARPVNVHEKLAGALRDGSQYLLALANRGDVAANERCQFLSACLKEVPDGAPLGMEELSKAQEAFWKLASTELTSAVAEILRRRRDVASSAAQTLEEVEGELKKRKDSWNGNGVVRESGQWAIDRLQAALTFCEDRKKSGTYAANVSVEASQNLGGQAPLTPRILRISTPGRNAIPQGEEIHLVPNKGRVPLDIAAKVAWGNDCWSDYENKVVMTYEKEDHTNEFITSRAGKTALLQPFRITPLQEEGVEINVHIRVTSSYFALSSRRHGKGTLTCTVSDLLQSPQTLTLDGTGAGGNKIVFTATTSDPKQRSGFHTERGEYQRILGLGSPIECRVALATDSSRDQQSFDAAKDPGPLAPIGLPLLRDREKRDAKYIYEQDGFRIELKFSSLPVVPDILWDAALLSREPRHE